MSGAGKSSAMRFFEDRGYLTIDNIPVALLSEFYVLLKEKAKGKNSKIACVVDSRSWDSSTEFVAACKKLKKNEADYRILFLNASNNVILNRYNLTRRKHPVTEFSTLLENIKEERKMLEPILKMAYTVIDTTELKPKELPKKLEKHLSSGSKAMTVSFSSFGFKFGIPIDLDLMFDVRFLPNPYYLDELKEKTGNDKEVQDYVKSFDETQEFFAKLCDMLEFLLPKYINEGKSHLSVGIGCSGGKHRSVTLVNELFTKFEKNEVVAVQKTHRDIEKH
jgi:UPF0042 nucleotide-binding protein